MLKLEGDKSIKVPRVVKYETFYSTQKTWLSKSEEIVFNIMRTMETHHDQGHADFLDTAIYIENPQNYVINRGAKAAIQNRFLGILCIGLHDTFPCPLYLVHPMTVKKVFTGDGRANKDKMVKVAKAMLAPNSIKRSKIDRETIADSLAIAITGMKHQLGKVKAEAL